MREKIESMMGAIPDVEAIIGGVKPFAMDYPSVADEFMRARYLISDTFYNYHKEYCLNVSNFSAVPDPEGLAFLMFLASKYPDRPVFECGSGFSTFCLRIMYDNVLSVETSELWKVATDNWLKLTNLDGRGEVITKTKEFVRSLPDTDHWAFLDGDPVSRRAIFKSMINKGTADFIVVDDMQFLHYRKPFLRMLNQRGNPYTLYHLHAETLGIRQRHMGIAVKKGFVFK